MQFFATETLYLAGAADFLTPLAITAGCLWLVILQVGMQFPARIVRKSGTGATALAQTLSFGAMSGALGDGSPLHEQDEEYELAQQRAA